MAVQYVKDFSFAPSPPRPTIVGYARGGHVKASTPQCYARGGLARGHGQSNDSGHVGKGGDDSVTRKGAGDGDIKRSKVSPDIGASRTEKSSGVQKPAFAKGGHWIAGAIKHPGALHKEMGIPQGQKIPAAKLKSAAGKGGKLGQRARLAETLKGMHKKEGGTAKCYAQGGRVADGAVEMGSKPSRNKDDATSPGSPKRTPMKQGDSNQSAARNKFATEGRGTPPATKQDGNVERMSGYSDFKSGGTVKHDRIKNLGHYAHGGKVKAPVAAVNASKAEKSAGTPKTSPGTRVERKSMGGLSRGTSPRKNAAIHAKSHKPKGGAGVGALAKALSGQAMPSQGAGAPPGMAPGMGAPPGGPMGAIGPQAPTMGGGPPAMSHGGQLKTFTHVAYK